MKRLPLVSTIRSENHSGLELVHVTACYSCIRTENGGTQVTLCQSSCFRRESSVADSLLTKSF